jgi:hypothetical protein
MLNWRRQGREIAVASATTPGRDKLALLLLFYTVLSPNDQERDGNLLLHEREKTNNPATEDTR